MKSPAANARNAIVSNAKRKAMEKVNAKSNK